MYWFYDYVFCLCMCSRKSQVENMLRYQYPDIQFYLTVLLFYAFYNFFSSFFLWNNWTKTWGHFKFTTFQGMKFLLIIKYREVHLLLWFQLCSNIFISRLNFWVYVMIDCLSFNFVFRLHIDHTNNIMFSCIL